jgi:hypothetical protein
VKDTAASATAQGSVRNASGLFRSYAIRTRRKVVRERWEGKNIGLVVEKVTCVIDETDECQDLAGI